MSNRLAVGDADPTWRLPGRAFHDLKRLFIYIKGCCFHLFTGPGTAHVGQMERYILFFGRLIDCFGMITAIHIQIFAPRILQSRHPVHNQLLIADIVGCDTVVSQQLKRILTGYPGKLTSLLHTEVKKHISSQLMHSAQKLKCQPN